MNPAQFCQVALYEQFKNNVSSWHFESYSDLLNGTTHRKEKQMNLIRWQRPVMTPWSSFGRLSDLRDEIDRLFEAPLAELTQTSNLLSGWTPALDVFEQKENFVIKAELPGMKKEDITVSLHDGSLSISGERKSETKHEDAEVYRAERFFGRFQRAVTLPAPIAADKVQAQYKDGVLTVTLPKTEEARPKQIDVSVG